GGLLDLLGRLLCLCVESREALARGFLLISGRANAGKDLGGFSLGLGCRLVEPLTGFANLVADLLSLAGCFLNPVETLAELFADCLEIDSHLFGNLLDGRLARPPRCGPGPTTRARLRLFRGCAISAIGSRSWTLGESGRIGSGGSSLVSFLPGHAS